MYRLYRLSTRLLEKILSRKYPERFSPPEEDGVEVWMHAASVGESRVAAAILEETLRLRPGLRVLLTLQTRSGLEQARKLLKSLPGIRIRLAPWDGPGTIGAWLRKLSPRVLVLVETELWPNLLFEALSHGTPVLILNGRLSSRSFSRYRRLRPLFAPLLARVSMAGVISEEDRERFLALGIPPERVRVLGNAKHDLSFRRVEDLDPVPLVRRLGLRPGERLLVFGSMRRGEEEAVSRIISGLISVPDLRFAVVPRHPERAPEFEKHLTARGLTVSFFRNNHQLAGARIIVVDEIGPLFTLYALAEAAVVGGSFQPLGGQNPLEPAILGKPVLFGPHMENFPLESRILLSGGGARQVNSVEEALSVLSDWLHHPDKAREQGWKAFQCARKLRGASRRYAELLLRFL